MNASPEASVAFPSFLLTPTYPLYTSLAGTFTSRARLPDNGHVESVFAFADVQDVNLADQAVLIRRSRMDQEGVSVVRYLGEPTGARVRACLDAERHSVVPVLGNSLLASLLRYDYPTHGGAWP